MKLFMSDTKANYWDTYYQKNNISLPSQFAAFCLNEFPDKYTIIDCGCGDGRDALFFAKYGRSVVGVDRSIEAVQLCKRKADAEGLNDATFMAVDFGDKNSIEQLNSNLHIKTERALIYARFFIHAIDETAEANFLKFCADLCKVTQGKIFFEFRTAEDEKIEKTFGQHYRRFIDLDTITSRLKAYGFEIEYNVRGRGFAKYKTEDAMVARVIAGMNV